MHIFATISDMNRLGLVLDTTTGAIESVPVQQEFFDLTVTGRAPCRPFGITWTATALFIGNNRQILAFDKRLRYVKPLPVRLQTNVHQLAFYNGLVWAVSPWTNSLIGVDPNSIVAPVEFNLQDHVLKAYIERDANENDDEDHFNSLLWTDTHLYVAAHAHGRPSFIHVYDATSFCLDYVMHDVGFCIHGLARHRDELLWISTDTAEIRSSAGYTQVLSRSGYARGLAVTEDHFVVGISEYLSRNERFGGDSWIQIIDRHTGVMVREFHLRDTGSINDLRLLDAYDYSHNLKPYWATSTTRTSLDIEASHKGDNNERSAT